MTCWLQRSQIRSVRTAADSPKEVTENSATNNRNKESETKGTTSKRPECIAKLPAVEINLACEERCTSQAVNLRYLENLNA